MTTGHFVTTGHPLVIQCLNPVESKDLDLCEGHTMFTGVNVPHNKWPLHLRKLPTVSPQGFLDLVRGHMRLKAGWDSSLKPLLDNVAKNVPAPADQAEAVHSAESVESSTNLSAQADSNTCDPSPPVTMEPVRPDEVCEGPEPLPGFADFMELDMPYEDRGAPWQYAYWYWQATGGQDDDTVADKSVQVFGTCGLFVE